MSQLTNSIDTHQRSHHGLEQDGTPISSIQIRVKESGIEKGQSVGVSAVVKTFSLVYDWAFSVAKSIVAENGVVSPVVQGGDGYPASKLRLGVE